MTQLEKAALTPFPNQGTEPDTSRKISFDFNPDTLTLKVTNTLEQQPARRGRQRRQFVGSTSATLNFDAVFDSTRPKSLPGENPGGERQEDLDVRRRTRAIASLLQVDNPDDRHPAPKRVRFSWGSVIFDGVMDTYTEVLEYFSPEGVPLRSKVSISLKEQTFEYQIDEDKRAQLASSQAGAGSGGAGSGGAGTSPTSALNNLGVGLDRAGDVAAQNGLDSLLDIGTGGGLSFDASLSLDLDAGVSFSAGLDLGVGVDIGFSAGASIGLSADVAVEMFGGAAVEAAVGAGVDLGASARGGARAPAGTITSRSPTSWAPAGPVAGSRAAALAAIVNAQRTSTASEPTAPGGSFTATRIEPKVAAPATAGQSPAGVGPAMVAPGTSASAALLASSAGEPLQAPFGKAPPVPVLGSPPRVPSAVGAPAPAAVFGKARSRPVERASLAGARPRWEAATPAEGDARGSAGPPGACCPACKKPRWAGGRAPCGCGGRRTS